LGIHFSETANMLGVPLMGSRVMRFQLGDILSFYLLKHAAVGSVTALIGQLDIVKIGNYISN
jgi:hypothetical protein